MAGRRILAALSASSGVGCRWATRKGICRVLRSSVARVVTTGSRAGKHNGRDGEWGCASRTKGLESRGPSRGTQDWKSSSDPGKIEGEGDERATRKKCGIE